MRSSQTRPFVIVLLVGALAGLFFAGVSTFDFAQHLDRQVHGLHCSFVPGLESTDVTGTSGCHVTLMSPYSSVLRSVLWGGIPIALPAMGVFAFLLWRSVAWLLAGDDRDQAGARVILAAAMVPVAASVVMGSLAVMVLDAICKVCAGIYISSAVVLVGAVGTYLASKKAARFDVDPYERDLALPALGLAPAAGLFAAYALVPALAWAALAPDQSSYIGTCGQLAVQDDPNHIFVPLAARSGGVFTLEVLDPLCPSCKGFEARLEASGHGERLDRQAVLFPLDASCNWMVGSTLHAGACTVSEAVLCAGDKAPDVVAWAFDHQDEVRGAAEADPEAAGRLVLGAFPNLKGCLGSTKVKARLNQSLRWAVRNELPVLTPQVYVDGVRICDADTDLGLDFALGRMLSGPEAP